MKIESYLEVEPADGTGINSGFIFNRALIELRDARVGHFAVAFPGSEEGKMESRIERRKACLGDKLQIFGSEEVVRAAHRHLTRTFGEYVEVSSVRQVREVNRYASYKRVQGEHRSDATVEREIRRAKKRAAEGKHPPVTDAEIRERKSSTKRGDLPFVEIRSHSTGQRFRAAFKRIFGNEIVTGDFDEFGFARNGATVPHISR